MTTATPKSRADLQIHNRILKGIWSPLYESFDMNKTYEVGLRVDALVWEPVADRCTHEVYVRISIHTCV